MNTSRVPCTIVTGRRTNYGSTDPTTASVTSFACCISDTVARMLGLCAEPVHDGRILGAAVAVDRLADDPAS